GEGLGEPQAGSLPERTGKVTVVRPSTHLVYSSGAMADALFWTQVHPAARNKIVREQDPPAIDGAWYSLDPSIRASGPGDVDTVIFCETRSIKVGTYGGQAAATSYAAYRFDKVLKAYDRRSGRFLGSCVVLGDDPAGSTTLLGPHAGKAPSVAEVIGRMPLSGG
ncbi:MAG: hypothetical protein HY721_11765, partial [Planctomycetes bacterium]|nr:hypothetical protein [Planctomycetota bacterium]